MNRVIISILLKIINFMRKEEEEMALVVICTTLITEGALKFKDTPKRVKEKVRQALIALGEEELTQED